MQKEDSKLSEFDSDMLESVSKNSGDIEEIPSILQKYVRLAVCQIIEHHQKVINLAKDADEVFSLLMLTQFLFSLGILCFMLFQLSLVSQFFKSDHIRVKNIVFRHQFDLFTFSA